MPVTRCVCHNVTFAELLGMHRRTGEGFTELQKATGCGSSCGSCIPYIHLALRSGRTALPVLSEPEARRVMSGDSLTFHGHAIGAPEQSVQKDETPQ